MISHQIGFSFAVPIMIFGIIVSLFGIPALFEIPILGIGIILAGAFFWSSAYGVQIDLVKNRFREYGSMYGIKKGKWQSLDKLPYLTVLKGKTGMTVYSRSNRATSLIDDRYEVCLLNQTHRKRITVKKFETKEKALTYCEELSDKLNKDMVKYDPVVSEKTLSRRRSRK